ncbi:MAG: hypothetical protein SH857_16200 [Chitinophagales bacterium]|nr:hypothetical protein [Chitinophagales bacterium]
MRPLIQITEKDETAKNLVKLLRTLSKKNRNIDFVTDELPEDVLDLHLAKKARRQLKAAIPFDAFMKQEKTRRKLA